MPRKNVFGDQLIERTTINKHIRWTVAWSSYVEGVEG